MISRLISILLALVASLALGSGVRGQATCPGDFNGDGVVDSVDLAGVLAAWGACEATIGSLSPTEGTVLGGTIITLTGTNLGQASVVTVGGNPCTGLTIVSANEIRATTPTGSAGPADVFVTTPAGNAAAPVPFTYRSQSVASITPASGPYAGGTSITITGQYLGGTTSVTIGGVPATEITILDSTTVTARTPPGSVGPQAVVVTGVKGTLVIPSGFTFFVSPLVPSWATLVEAFPDPAVVTDAALREAIAATGYAWRVRDSGTQIEMLLIPPGTFSMGCSAALQFGCDADEYPIHPVTLTNAFYLGRYEVTQAQWTTVMGSNPSFFQGPEHPKSESRPVEQVSWNMVQQFNTATGFRLPTEAQWEHACRAGTTTAVHSFAGYPNGTNDDWLVVSVAWCGTWDCTFGFPQNCQARPVGLKQANGFGLHDMLGNVWEATADWYSATYYQTSPPIDPQGPSSGQFRVRRGGSFVEAYGSGSRSSSRDTLFPPSGATYSTGFRVARDP